MTLAKVHEASIATMTAAAEVEDTVEEITALDVITMTATVEDTVEAVIATTTDLVSTDTREAEAVTTTDVEVAVATEIVTIVVDEMTVMVAAAMVHHRLLNMVIQLLAERLENLMVVGSLTPAENTDLSSRKLSTNKLRGAPCSLNCTISTAYTALDLRLSFAGALPLGNTSHLFSIWT